MKKIAYKIIAFLSILFIGLQSCKTTTKIAYFKEVTDTVKQQLTHFPQSYIQPGDILHISVAANSVEDAAIFNLPLLTQNTGNSLGGTNIQVGNSLGYQVDSAGYIKFPLIGSILVKGLTKEDIGQLIEKKLLAGQFIVNPIVNVRLQNFKVTVLGEVARPSIFYLPNERVTLPEALGYAGDLTIFGRRDNVLLIREEAGVRSFSRINLQNEKLFVSPHYYLKNNDILYVEPVKAKKAETEKWRQDAPIILGVLSFLTALLIAVKV